MVRASELASFDFALRSNRLDGPGLYYGRPGHVGPVDAARFEQLLRAWQGHDPYMRMGTWWSPASGRTICPASWFASRRR